MATKIILVRHGETEWNRVERFRGQFDIELNENGMVQARATSVKIHNTWQPKLFFCSPLKRAFQTAQMIAEPFGSEPTGLPDLIDINYGKWQGLSPEEVKSHWPEELDAWYHNPEKTRIPDGENLAEVQERAFAFISSLVVDYPDSDVVVVSHTVVNRLILMKVIGSPLSHFWSLDQHPCAINLIEHNGSGFILRSMNSTCHLEKSEGKPI